MWRTEFLAAATSVSRPVFLDCRGNGRGARSWLSLHIQENSRFALGCHDCVDRFYCPLHLRYVAKMQRDIAGSFLHDNVGETG